MCDNKAPQSSVVAVKPEPDADEGLVRDRASFSWVSRQGSRVLFSVYSSVCLVHVFPTGKVDCAGRQVFGGRVPR